MKNIKNAAVHKLIFICLLWLSFVPGNTSGLHQPENKAIFYCKDPQNILRDTFPFFKRQHTPIKMQEDKDLLFPDSEAFRTSNNCEIAFDGTDPVTGDRKKELHFEPILSYTSPKLKPYVSGKDLLSAEGKLIKVSGGYTYLSIQFRWDAKNPQNAYGSLKRNGAIRCQLAHDKSITLYNNKESLWQMGIDNTSHILQTIFLLHPKQIKLLKKYPLMKMTIFWERGFEEYPIYPIGFFMNQLKCLEL